MRKIFFTICFLISAFLLILFSVIRKKTEVPDQPKLEVLTEESKDPPAVSDTDYSFSYFTVSDPETVLTISNIKESLTGSEASGKYGCEKIVNAGFYDENQGHIGLFISGGKTLSDARENKLFNGYFSVKKDGFEISRNLPLNPLYAFQSGPLLVEDGIGLKIKSANDKKARRITAALDQEDILYFIAVFSPDSYFSGPYLSEMPGILEKIENETGKYFINALNLDGGNHSVFISDDIKLTELLTAGGFICIR